MIDPETREEIKAAYRAGLLRVEAVNPATLAVDRYPLRRVMRHSTPTKPLFKVETEDGRSGTFTGDHSIFTASPGGLRELRTDRAKPGTYVVVVEHGRVRTVKVKTLTQLPPEAHTYDLEVPGPQNFRLSSGLLAHNSYSIGGVSLDIEKSSKYQAAKENAEGQFDKAVEGKLQTTKYMVGLKQSRFGIGVRSAFGPYVGRGVMSPRNFKF